MLRAFGLVCLIYLCAAAAAQTQATCRPFQSEEEEEEKADDNGDDEEEEWCEVLSVYVHVFLNTQVLEILRH